jgi:integrase
MASIYRRPDSLNFCLSCYPRPGAKLVRASLGTDDQQLAEKVARKVDLLIELEKMADVEVPWKILSTFEALNAPGRMGIPSAGDESTKASGIKLPASPGIDCPIDDVLKAFLVRSMVSNADHFTADKISRLRQFFGSVRINALDPRPPEKLKHARKGKVVKAWFKGNDLKEITTMEILLFFAEKNYSRASKRHFRELFHEIFQGALKSGMYRPDNPYAANPAADLSGFSGREEAVNVLNPSEVEAQYRAVSSDPLVEFGCRLMIEGGFRLHEILALRQTDLLQTGKIRLILPKRNCNSKTKLKTGERTVTVRPELQPYIDHFLASHPRNERAWCFPSRRGLQMTSDGFGTLLRDLNRREKLAWTSQDFRHTYATNRIAEGWNLKTLADEMGTSIAMLMDHYAGYIDPPVLAALAAGAALSR